MPVSHGLDPIVVGVVADTHGLLRPAALAALRGVALIIHAGDVGRPDLLAQLEEVAPVAAVRGNVDRGPWARDLPETRVVEAGGSLVYVLHDLSRLDLDPAAAGFAAVVSGHSHQPGAAWRQSVLYLNPGSIGPRRFNLPVSLARLRLGTGAPAPELIELPV
jgi:putative phosphoesterase